jgi:hypothetical protein
MADPFGSPAQAVQLAPQAAASLSALHALPQRWYPLAHVKSHVLPVHVAMDAPAGTGQAVHEVPQELTLVSGAQTPLQSCVPAEQTAEHGEPEGMQVPAQTFWPMGHVAPHAPASHVDVPPMTIGHAVHELPQLAGEASLMHLPPHE